MAGSDAWPSIDLPYGPRRQWAAFVLDEESGRFTIGPLTEVVAQHHRFDGFAWLPGGTASSVSSLRRGSSSGQSISNEVANPLEIPFAL